MLLYLHYKCINNVFMDWFRNHYVDWKQWDRNSDMKDEISSFISDWYIDSKEEKVLKKILDYNLVKKNREKLVLQRTTKEKLEELSYYISFKSKIHNQILKILSLSENISNNWNQNIEEYIDYLQQQDFNSLKVEAKELWKSKIKELQKIIWAKVDWIFWPNTFKKYKESNPDWKDETLSIFLDYNNEHDSVIIHKNSDLLTKSFKVWWRHYNGWFKNITEEVFIQNENLDNNNFIENLDLKWNYKRIAYEFISKLKSNEILNRETPIALVDSSKKEMAYIIDGKVYYEPVLLWKNWTVTWWYINWDKKTPKWYIHRFDINKSKIASTIDWDASNSWYSKTVLSASLQSDTSTAFGWRYFHWVAQYRIDWRFNGMWTWWCVWVNVNFIRKMYNDVLKNWWWYWYVW